MTHFPRRLEHEREEVRSAVVEGLSIVARRGDPLAVDEVCARLDHKCAHTREAAALALAQVGKAGDERALESVSVLLGDVSALVRHAAVLAVFFLGDVGADVSQVLEIFRKSAQRLLREMVIGNQGRGDKDLKVKEAAGRLADKLDRQGHAYYRYSAAKEVRRRHACVSDYLFKKGCGERDILCL